MRRYGWSAHSIIVTGLLFTLLISLCLCEWTMPRAAVAADATDRYFGTQGMPQGPAAPAPHETVYSRIGSFDSRLLVWFVTQQHTYFGGFVLALPMFCVILEFAGLIGRDRSTA